MGRKSQKDRKWKAETDQLRTASSQKFIEKHEEKPWSPRSSSKKSDTGSSASEKGSPLSTRKKRKKDGTRNRTPAIGIDGTVLSRERSNTIGARDGVSASEKDGTVSNRERSDSFSFGTRDEYEDVPLQALERIKIKHEESKADEEPDREEAAHNDLARGFSTIRSRRKNLTQNRKLGQKTTEDQLRTDHGRSSEIRHSPDHGSELRPSKSEQLDGSNNESHPEPSLTSVSNEGENRPSHIEQMKRYSTDNHPEIHAKHKNRSPETPLQDPGPGYGFPADKGIIGKDFGSRNPQNQQESQDGPQPHAPKPNHSIDETSDQENQAASDLSQKPEETETLSETPLPLHNKERDSLDSQPQQSGSGPSFVDEGPIHDSVEEQVELGINLNEKAPDSPRSPEKANARPIHNRTEEQVDLGNTMNDKAPNSPHSPRNPNARLIHNPAKEQLDPEVNKNHKEPDGTHPPGTIGNKDARPIDMPVQEQVARGIAISNGALDGTLSSDTTEKSDAPPIHDPVQEQVNPGIEAPDSTHSPDTEKTADTRPIHDPVEEKVDPGDDDAPDSTHPLDTVGIESQDDQDTLEEKQENSGVSRASVELSAGHRDNSPSRPPSEEPEGVDERGAEAATEIQGPQGLEGVDERGAEALTDIERRKFFDAFYKEILAETATNRRNGSSRRKLSWPSSISTASSVGSLLLSPDRDGTESPINRGNVADDVEEAKENKASNLIELHRANFELRTKLKLREANFKREIQKAWIHPRPPPTTSEQRADKRALEKMESMKIFDEFGDQQRPIRTEPQLVVWETGIHTMIHNARINYLLEDFPKMYMHANHAVAAASQLHFPSLTAMCCYYRGMASYHHREFATAKTDFETSRGCAGLFGISGEVIEKHIDLIDSEDDPETAILQRFPPPRSKAIVARAERTATSPDVDDEDEPPSPSPADDAATLVEGSPGSPQDTALPLPPFLSLSDELRSVGEIPEETDSQISPLRRPSPLGESSLDDDDPQPSTSTDDDVPNYKPQEEAISEEIRKSIFESKAQSLDPVNEAGPTVANAQEKKVLSPPSMASTEWTLLGSATSQGTTRRVPRPHIAPINTSLAPVTRPAVREVRAEAYNGDGDSGEMDEDEIMAAFNTKREDATPDTPDSGY